MKTYKERIWQSLVDHGWEVDSCHEADEWWAEEHWLIRSVREYWGRELVLTFLVDPLYDGQDKGVGVWAVAANQSQPSDRLSAEDGIALIRVRDMNFPETLEHFVTEIDVYRRAENSPVNTVAEPAPGNPETTDN